METPPTWMRLLELTGEPHERYAAEDSDGGPHDELTR
jgi:hypothetical protein